MKKLSINNGLSYLNLDCLSIDDAIYIERYWDSIVSLMDNDVCDKMDVVDQFSKFEILRSYLEISDDNLVVG